MDLMTTHATSALPTLFVSHGSPLLAVEDSPTGRWLDGLGNSMRPPRAVVVASAHALAAAPCLSGGLAPRTLHDFGGFPKALYALDYPAPGHPQLANAIAARLRAAGFEADADARMPFDHGVWVPLRRMLPGANVPVVALTIAPNRDAAWHYALGQALAPLRFDDVLVIGSGGFVHNLATLDWRDREAPTPAWANAFATWLDERVQSNQWEDAIKWDRSAPSAALAHPTSEHLLPLFVAWGAGSSGGMPVHRGWQHGTLSMQAFAFGGNLEVLPSRSTLGTRS